MTDQFKPSQNFLFRLSKETLMKAKRVFDSCDQNFDGTIKMEDFPRCFRAMGVLINESDMKKLILEIDPDKTGLVTLGTFFVQLARKLRDADSMEKLVRGSVGKLYIDPRLLRKQEDIDPSKEIRPIIPLSNLRSLLSAPHMGEPLTEREIESLLIKIEASKLMDEQGDVVVDDLWKLLCTPVEKAVQELPPPRDFDLM